MDRAGEDGYCSVGSEIGHVSSVNQAAIESRPMHRIRKCLLYALAQFVKRISRV